MYPIGQHVPTLSYLIGYNISSCDSYLNPLSQWLTICTVVLFVDRLHQLSNMFQIKLVAGIYYPFIRDWIDVFGHENIHIITLEDYKQNKDTVMKNIFQFLELGKCNFVLIC